MGEAKRRKKLDPTWGKFQPIAVELLSDEELAQLDFRRMMPVDATNAALRIAGYEVLKCSKPGEERTYRLAKTPEDIEAAKLKRHRATVQRRNSAVG